MYAKEPQNEQNFLTSRRDVMLDYRNYVENFEEYLDTFEFVSGNLTDPTYIRDEPVADLMSASELRAWEAVSYMHLQYSVGMPVGHLHDFYPLALDYWQEYAVYHERFHATPEAGGRKVPHLDLYDKDYWRALRLCCFAILLGHTDKLPRLCAIWDYENDDMDGLLERLVAPFVSGRAAPPDECTRHLPYFKTLKIFAAAPEKRPALMARYLDEWYVASRREPYYDSHTEGRDHNYLGYWSFEAAAITIVLDIDDSSYRDMQFYPRDLVDYGRTLRNESAAPASNSESRLRALPNESVPKTGWWWSPAFSGEEANRFFQQGERFPETETTSYGAVVWYYDPDKQAKE
jgi:hypothetical protein